MTEPAFSFSNVDASGRAAALERQLRVQADLFEADRRTRLALLRLGAGGSALDLGCGLGEVALMLSELVGPTGSVVGVDASESMVARAGELNAAAPNVDIRRGDVMALEFADASFDAVYSERVFMHLDDPDQALAEAVRVTKPGGQVMIVDPDHSMTRIEAADVDTAIAVFWAMARSKMKNPRSGSRLVEQFHRADLVDVEVHGTISLFRSPLGPDSFHASLAEAAAGLVAEGDLSRAQADAFLDEIAGRIENGTFRQLLPMITVVGTKPGR